MDCRTGVCAYGRVPVLGSGPCPARFTLIGEAPGRQELQQGRPFVGPAGKLLDQYLETAGILRSECRILNTVGCVDLDREVKKPTPGEIAACKSRLMTEIEEAQSRIVVLLGGVALQHFYPGLSISRARGKPRSWQGRIVIPTFHPAASLPYRSPEIAIDIIRDLELARSLEGGSIWQIEKSEETKV